MVDSEKNVIGVDFGEKFTGIGEPLILENLFLSNNANTHDFSNACNDDYYVEDRWLAHLNDVECYFFGNSTRMVCWFHAWLTVFVHFPP
ncbi:hypothetical protein Q3G72_022266 [Acer saccharum]|nr:hypothetical protein Q3G72_022266 [Acer saccharum]